MKSRKRARQARSRATRPPRAKSGRQSALDNLRQLLHAKAFRIPPPAWPADLIEAMTGAGETVSGDKGRSPEPSSAPSPYGTAEDLVRLIAQVATGVWRARRKMPPEDADDVPREIRQAARHLQSVWDALESALSKKKAWVFCGDDRLKGA